MTMASDNTYSTSGPQGDSWRYNEKGYRTSAIHGKNAKGGGKKAAPSGKKAGGGGKKASPYKISPGKTGSIKKTEFSPDLAPSPNPFQPGSPVGPGDLRMSPGPSGRGPIYEPGGGVMPRDQDHILDATSSLVAVPSQGHPPGGLGARPPVPMNPAMSQASILQQPPPALQPPNRQMPAMTQPFVKPETLGGGISSIFFDPNRPRRW